MNGEKRKARRKETTRKTKTWVDDNIKMDPREIGLDGMDCIDLAVGGNESSNSIKYWEGFE
jgi:hypothetical protein